MTDYAINKPLYDHFDSLAAGRTLAANGGGTSLDTEETTGKSHNPHSYRAFLVSGIPGDMTFTESVYREWDEITLRRRHSQLLLCRTSAWFMVHRETKAVRVSSTACGLRWCPLCIRTRRHIITESTMQWLQKTKKAKFLTFTLKHHTSPLGDQIDALYKYFRAIRKHPLFKSKIQGGIWFFQVKKSKDERYWHPHIHCLCEGKYIDQRDLSKLWEKITHGSRIVDIRAVKDNKKSAEYVARYAAAPCRLFGHTLPDAVEIVSSLHGRRICGTFGTAKGIALRPHSQEDIGEWVCIDSYHNISLSCTIDENARLLWIAWTNDEPYAGQLPDPPPKIDEAFQKEIDRPRTFNETFFEFVL
jgi:hypothetical protein